MDTEEKYRLHQAARLWAGRGAEASGKDPHSAQAALDRAFTVYDIVRAYHDALKEYWGPHDSLEQSALGEVVEAANKYLEGMMEGVQHPGPVAVTDCYPIPCTFTPGSSSGGAI